MIILVVLIKAFNLVVTIECCISWWMSIYEVTGSMVYTSLYFNYALFLI